MVFPGFWLIDRQRRYRSDMP